MNLKQRTLFNQSVFIGSCTSISKNELQAECERIYQNSYCDLRSGRNAYQSKKYTTQSLSYDYTSLHAVLKIIQQSLDVFCSSIERKDQTNNKRLVVDNFWLNVNINGSSNILHTHPESVLSGVYYVNAPENSGDIVFYSFDSNLNDTSYGNYVYESTTSHIPMNRNITSITPEDSMLIMFPSHYLHSVDTSLSQEKRISISFNSRLCDI